MTALRVGTRGSDLALWQTRWVVRRLLEAHPSLKIEEIIIKTHGDVAKEQRFDTDWPVGGFVGAIEQALSAEQIDFAVHSYKDLQTAVTAGLVIAAVPGREVVNDALVTPKPVDLENLPNGFRLGTSSPRRAAQFRRVADVEIVAIRGNVPTRIAKLERENLDGVVLAAAGLERLGLSPPHRINLPTDRFVPTPAQGALAIQTRDSGPACEIIGVLDDGGVRRGIDAERAFLQAIGAGCHTPVGALSTVQADSISLHAQLFTDDGSHRVEGVERGTDPLELGARLAKRLLGELGRTFQAR